MRRSVYIIVLLLLAPPVYADGTLRDAVERAWERQPAYQAQPARAEEFAAKRDAAQALFPEPPSLFATNRSDRLHRNEGQRELEAGIALPLWLPGEQGRQAAVVSAERDQYDTALAAAKLKVAGEVRDAYWQARLTENELALARRKVEEGGDHRGRCRASRQGRRSGARRSQSGAGRGTPGARRADRSRDQDIQGEAGLQGAHWIEHVARRR